ncbi:hypothetical protein AAJ76_900016403 [Vairimorpha ceranae]|uniref:Uncharacterized protein n=1 Tax=Vairimorpha ceranae TaxID=40302 RepID=A0A0F9YTV0_9MICR|nr:hypothetical protein AAJ76_900016403 [Vairimorpha ceranae]KAF5141183.1 hypothetical protein G9O61_00g005000 [Vairimorpha ceranae]KKO75912.1 hypothetical protein AAJ76_900016403 [Vairimorpha ceranae]
MVKEKIAYGFVLLILILHHYKYFIRDIILQGISNYKLETLILHGIYPMDKEIDNEYANLLISNQKIFRVYNLSMILSLMMPVIVPFIRLL